MSTGQSLLQFDEVDGVVVATFVDKQILNEINIEAIGKQLFALVDDQHRKRIILNFSHVDYMSSAALGKLIKLDKKVAAAQAKLRMCCIRPDVYETFSLLRLETRFDIKGTLEEALEGFQPPSETPPSGT